MTKAPGFTREMRPGEEAGVEALLRLAFGGLDEARLVAALRKSGAMAGEMVLPCDGGIIGYYALSRFIRPKGWLCLAPVAIHPDWQGMRHGKRMIGQLTEWARLSGTCVVVLGQPEFYGRTGFSAARAAQLGSPYPLDHTLLAGPGTDAPRETLVYPKPFDAV